MRTLLKTHRATPTVNRFFFDDIFGKDIFDFNTNNLVKNSPAVNVKENENEYLLEVAAPGFQKENFVIEVNEGILSISAEIKAENKESEANSKFTRREFSYSTFKRTFNIDEEIVDADNIVAKYENGILNIIIPKKVKIEEEKKAKTISVL